MYRRLLIHLHRVHTKMIIQNDCDAQHADLLIQSIKQDIVSLYIPVLYLYYYIDNSARFRPTVYAFSNNIITRIISKLTQYCDSISTNSDTKP